MLENIPEVSPEARYQRYTVHFYRNVFTVTPRTKMRTVTMMLKAIHAQESKQSAREKAASIVHSAAATRNETVCGCPESGGKHRRDAYIHGLSDGTLESNPDQ